MARLPNSNPEAGFSAIAQITTLYCYDKTRRGDPLFWVAAGRIITSEQPLTAHDGREMDQTFPPSIVMVTPTDMNNTLKDLNDLASPVGSIVKLKNIRVLGHQSMAVGGWELISDAGVKTSLH